jgi:Transposase DDE domain
MAKLARSGMGVDKLTAIADREEILACHEAGISVFVPKTVTSSATAHGRFGKDDFIYNAQTNEYRCPAGERLIWRFSTVERGLKISKYWSSNCQQCPLKGNCTPGPQRRVTRWEHEAVLDDMQARLDRPAHISEPAGRPEGASSRLIMKCSIPNPTNGEPVRNEAVIGL